MAPLLEDLEVVDEDNEVVRAALVEDLGGWVVGARHGGLCCIVFFSGNSRECRVESD